jgi:GT2 family glycosyltransferase
MAFTRGTFEDPENWNTSQFVKGLSGVCFAISKENYLKLGGFDEKIFLYMEDSEFSWRLNANHFKILYIPQSLIYHYYDFNVSVQKIYDVELGRYIILRKYLTSREYILLAPSFLMTEILTWGYAALNGTKGISSKLNAIKDVWAMPVEKINVKSSSLLKHMDNEIPELEFRFKPIFRASRKIANFIYRNNIRIL